MKTRFQVMALASLVPIVASVGCARVQAKAALKDANKLYKEENFKRAIEGYEKALQYDPSMAEAEFYLGSSHQALYRPGKDTADNKEHLDKAIEFYKKSLELNSADTPNLKKVKVNALALLTGIYSEPPYQDYDKALSFASQLVADNPNDSKNLYAMANLYEKFGKVAEAEKTYKQIADANQKDVKACGALAAFYNKPLWDEQGNAWEEGSNKPRRSKFDLAIEVLERCASLDPNAPSGYQTVATYYWDKAYRDPLLTDKQKDEYADKGLGAVDKALKLKPDYFEAIIFKGLLYRVKAQVATNPRQRMQYLDEAQTLQKQGLELKKEAAAAQAAASPSPSAGH